MISTISESFALRAKLTVLPLQYLIRIEGAGEHQIQYLGYVKSSVCLPELNKFFDILFLVVPDTPYHGRVPVLIGTNMLSSSFSEAVSSDQRLSNPWRLAMQSLTGQRKYKAKSGIVGSVKTTKPMTIPAGGRVMVQGLTRAGAGTSLPVNVLVDF